MESTALTLPARAAIALQSTTADELRIGREATANARAEQEAKKTAEWRRFAERLDLISDRCAGMEYWQLDEVIIAIDELLAKWAAA